MRISFFVLMMFASQSLKISGFNMECDFQKASWSYVTGIKCTVKNLRVTSSNDTVTSINGQDASYYRDRNVKMLDISSQIANFLPIGIEKFFQNLEGIQIYSSKLKSITQADLRAFANLKELFTDSNDLEVLDGNLFEFNPDLMKTNFNGNKIKTIGGNIFDGVKNLQRVHLQNNVCINKIARNRSEIPDIIAEVREKCESEAERLTREEAERKRRDDEELARIKEKYCSEDIKSLSEENQQLKAELSLLKTKFMACNGMLDTLLLNFQAVINKDFVIDPPLTSEVDLICKTGNEETCEAVDFKVAHAEVAIAKVKNADGKILLTDKVKSLMIKDQQTLFLPTNLIVHFARLMQISVTESGLFLIGPATFERMNNLQSLILSSNKIMNIRPDTFKDLINLTSLDLSLNRIMNIQSGAFNGLGNLQELNINDNSIHSINEETFKGLASLKVLKLHKNNLKFIIPNLLSQFPQLSSADLSSNICVNLSYPEQTKQQIRQVIVDNCIALLELKCNFLDGKIFIDEKISFDAYMCNIVELKVETEMTKVTKISGNHATRRDINSVAAFVSINQRIKFIPLSLGKFFSKIERFVIERSGLTSIDKEDFEGFAELQSISLRNNNLMSIGDGTFDELVKVEYINLANNQITSLPSQTFSNLLALKTLKLSFNNLVTLSADILPRKNIILELSFDHNKLKYIDSYIMRSLKKAALVDFSSNNCIDAKYERDLEVGKSFSQLRDDLENNCEDE